MGVDGLYLLAQVGEAIREELARSLLPQVQPRYPSTCLYPVLLHDLKRRE